MTCASSKPRLALDTAQTDKSLPVIHIKKSYVFSSPLNEEFRSGLEVIKLGFILRLKIKRNDWLLADACPKAANHCTLFWSD